MKKLLVYIGVFIVITAFILLFFIKSFPLNIAELSLEGSTKPEQVDKAMEDMLIYDFLNIYNIFGYGGNISVYSGNINMLLKDSNIEAIELTFKDNEVIMGEGYMKERFNYSLLGEKYTSVFGEYYVNCIINDSENIYYRNLRVLENTDIKNQLIYLSLLNTKKQTMGYNSTINSLREYGINVSKGIYYADVINFYKKLLILLVVSALVIIFFRILSYTKNAASKLVAVQRSSKYDIDFGEFIAKPNNLGLIVKVIFQVVIQLFIGATILWLTVFLLNIKSSYEVDFTSLKSILKTLNSFIDLIKYYVANGFTDISLAIVKSIIIYVSTIIIIFVVNSTKLAINISTKK